MNVLTKEEIEELSVVEKEILWNSMTRIQMCHLFGEENTPDCIIAEIFNKTQKEVTDLRYKLEVKNYNWYAANSEFDDAKEFYKIIGNELRAYYKAKTEEIGADKLSLKDKMSLINNCMKKQNPHTAMIASCLLEKE